MMVRCVQNKDDVVHRIMGPAALRQNGGTHRELPVLARVFPVASYSDARLGPLLSRKGKPAVCSITCGKRPGFQFNCVRTMRSLAQDRLGTKTRVFRSIDDEKNRRRGRFGTSMAERLGSLSSEACPA